jgi:hypothetical protein
VHQSARKLNIWQKSTTDSDYLIISCNSVKERYWILRNNYVNSEKDSDGWYFTDNDQFVRISGNIIIKEIKGLSSNAVISKYDLKSAICMD